MTFFFRPLVFIFMSIKHIIDSEIRDINFDLIIEGLSEIINDKQSRGLNDNFKKWFRASKVVDKSGKPLVMHHGGSFSASKPSEEGMTSPFNEFKGVGWFTSSKADARSYAKQSGGGNLTSAYIKIENPLYSGKQEDGSFIETNEAVLLAKKSNGKYDGVIDKDNSENILDAIVWDSKQIKSINNNGEYNSSDPDVMNEIISNGNFTTVLSENDNIALSENVYKVYHGTNNKFSKFNFKNATQGIIWFTDSIDSIKQGEHGGAGNNIIMTRYITINKPAGWAEYEKYGLQQLQNMGYDGVILPQDNKTDYFVFSPKSISAKDNTNSPNKDSSNNPNPDVLTEDGDVVCNIVNDELNADNCTLEENNSIVSENNKSILSEGLSDILYHFTWADHLVNILKTNKFATSSNLGSNADSWKDKGRFYFFSTQRTKGMSGYGSRHGNVAIVLDGRKLNYNFKGQATDYWNWSTKMADYKTKSDYINALKSEENEDRIVTNKPYIDNANKYIIEIHVWAKYDDRPYVSNDAMETILAYCKSYNIPVFFYDDENNFKLQNKLKAVDPTTLGLVDKEKSAYDEKEGERDLYNAKWFFKKIAPAIIANNDNEGYNTEREAVEKLLKDLLEKGSQPDQFDNVMLDINDKVKRMGTSRGYGYMYGEDEFLGMQAEIHNHRGDPNPYLRELLKMLINDMKKWGVKNLKEYFNKKFNTGIK